MRKKELEAAIRQLKSEDGRLERRLSALDGRWPFHTLGGGDIALLRDEIKTQSGLIDEVRLQGTRLEDRLTKLDGGASKPSEYNRILGDFGLPWLSFNGLKPPSVVDSLKAEQRRLESEVERLEGDLNQLRALDGEYYRRGKQVLLRRIDKRRDKPVLTAADIMAAKKAVVDLNKQAAKA